MAMEEELALPAPKPSPDRDRILGFLATSIQNSVLVRVPRTTAEISWMALHCYGWDQHNLSEQEVLAKLLALGKVEDPLLVYEAIAVSWASLPERLKTDEPYDHPKFAMRLREGDQGGLKMAEELFTGFEETRGVRPPVLWIDYDRPKPQSYYDSLLEKWVPRRQRFHALEEAESNLRHIRRD